MNCGVNSGLLLIARSASSALAEGRSATPRAARCRWEAACKGGGRPERRLVNGGGGGKLGSARGIVARRKGAEASWPQW